MVKKIIHKLQCVVYILFRSVFRKRPKQSSNNVLIITAGGLGDALFTADAYIGLIKYFLKLGKNVFLVADSTMISALKLFLNDTNVNLMVCDYLNGEMNEDKISSFKETIGKLNTLEFCQTIVWSNTFLQYKRACVMAAHISSKCTSAMLYSECIVLKDKILFAVSSLVIDQFLEFEKELNYPFYTRRFVTALGADDYKIKIQYLQRQSDFTYDNGKKYITVAVDSAGQTRRWPTDRFIELTKKMLEAFEYDVVLVGKNLSKVDLEKYEDAFSANWRVKIRIGKTNFADWVELIRGAEFHIGVDSGSIHVAASVGTQAFCLAGIWDHSFIPYQIEEETNGTKEPICIYRSDIDLKLLPCANCRVKGYYFGNKACRAVCRAKMPNLCLANIQVADVYNAIVRSKRGELTE